MTTPRDLLKQAKELTRHAVPEEVEPRLGEVVLLDVREPEEYEQGALPGAIHIPRGHLEFNVEGKIPDKSAPVDPVVEKAEKLRRFKEELDRNFDKGADKDRGRAR